MKRFSKECNTANRREYTEEFKLEAIAKIGRDLGIDGSMLSKWVKKYDGKMCGAYTFPGNRINSLIPTFIIEEVV